MRFWRLRTTLLSVTSSAFAIAFSTIAFAQATVPAPDQGGASTQAPAGGMAPAQGGTTTSTTTVFPVYPGAVAPTPEGQVVGGGNTASTSSSHPVTGDQEDHFDLGQNKGGGGTAHGDENGPVFLGGGRSGSLRVGGGAVPGTYIVKKGDTLWDICDGFFQNPYEWPRVWSYNPQLQNPHWIYPGDEIRLKSLGISISQAANAPPEDDKGLSSLVDRRRQVPNNTIFLRDQGFIDNTQDQNWGEIIGSPVDKMFLSDFDPIYLKMAGSHDVKLGQELTIFRPVRQVPGGQVVQIQGTVRIDSWNAKDRIARGQIIESLDVIERGARTGPIMRKFSITPPARNENDVSAHVLASIHQHEFYGQNQVIFIDKGEKDGLKSGNRLFIIRKGDAWRQSLASETDATRIALESNSPAETEPVPTPHNTAALPEEVVGELRVVDVRDHTATCILTQSRREIETGDNAVARKGY